MTTKVFLCEKHSCLVCWLPDSEAAINEIGSQVENLVIILQQIYDLMKEETVPSTIMTE